MTSVGNQFVETSFKERGMLFLSNFHPSFQLEYRLENAVVSISDREHEGNIPKDGRATGQESRVGFTDLNIAITAN